MRALPLLALGLGVALAGCGGSSTRPPSPTPHETIYLSGVRPGTITKIDVSRHKTHTYKLHGVGPGDPPYMLAATGGRLVTFTLGHTFSYAETLRSKPRLLGDSWFFVPSAKRGRVWLALLGNPRTAALRGLREVTVDGRTTVAHTAKPPSWPLAALDTGLVVQRKRLELWNPVTGAIEQRLPGVFPLAAHGSLLASCEDPCPRLHVIDTRTRAQTDFQAGADFEFMAGYDGAFSPDGRLLAVPAKLHRGGYRVAVLDLKSRRARLLNGPRLAAVYQFMTFGSNGHLYFHAPRARLAEWDGGAAKPRVIAVHIPPSTAIAAL